MTSAYLINRLPSSILQWQTLHYHLFGQQAYYSTLRILDGYVLLPLLHQKDPSSIHVPLLLFPLATHQE